MPFSWSSTLALAEFVEFIIKSWSPEPEEVISPLLNAPLLSLATIVLAVFALVALLVIVTAPVEPPPERPVPETLTAVISASEDSDPSPLLSTLNVLPAAAVTVTVLVAVALTLFAPIELVPAVPEIAEKI